MRSFTGTRVEKEPDILDHRALLSDMADTLCLAYHGNRLCDTDQQAYTETQEAGTLGLHTKMATVFTLKVLKLWFC